jgi:predicted metalloprotease with PDZ domain
LKHLGFVVAALLLTAAKAPEQRTIRYRVAPVKQADGSRALAVRMKFRGDADGETVLELPTSWAGSDELWRFVKGLEIRGAKKLSGFYDVPILHHKPGAKIKVRYNVVSAYAEDPGFAYEKARPMVRPDWFFVHGETIFVQPRGREASPARFRWGKIPKGWKVASDLDHLRRYPSSLANLVNSVAIGGKDLRVVSRTTGEAQLRVAMVGHWRFEPDAMADLVQTIVLASDALWGEKSTPFLVAMAPLGDVPTGLTYTGTGRTDAFSIASTGAFDLAAAKRFLAHEYMHTWVPIMLGAMPEEEASDYWFSEGFADYLAAKVLVRSGLWSMAEYVADTNETLLRYGISPVRNATATEVAEGFWFDPNLQRLSYDRGHLLAARIDAEIAAARDGMAIEDVLRAQRRIADGSTELATTLFRKTLLEQTGIDMEAEVERYMRRGAAMTLPADLFGECARLVSDRRRTFDRGFDAAATRRANGVIAGVTPEGPAYAAGMRNGMRLIEREAGKIGDSSVEIAYRVADAAGERVLRYFPAGQGEFEVQRMELTAAGPEQEARCKARFGGKA